MSPPGNGIFVVRGEMSTLTTAMRRGSRWSFNTYQDDDKDVLLKSFQELKEVLLQVEDLRLVEPNVFLSPFLDVIRSEETTGPVTSLALSAVNKFLSYGLIDPTHSTLAATVENIADAVTHARFVGTDQTSDGVVLMKIIQVLRTLVLSPEGSALSDESMCDIILSCFRLCFEPRLNELVRRTAENALKDIVLLLFMRLPQFVEGGSYNTLKTLKMRSSSMDQSGKRRKYSKTSMKEEQKPAAATAVPSTNAAAPVVPKIVTEDPANVAGSGEEPVTPVMLTAPNRLKPMPLSTTPATPAGVIVDLQGTISQTPKAPLPSESAERQSLTSAEDGISNAETELETVTAPGAEEGTTATDPSFVNSVGVRFTSQQTEEDVPQVANGAATVTHLPYGLPCIRELFRFLISLCNPMDKQNGDVMIHMGLTLLTVTFEVGADSIGRYDSLIAIVKDDLCRNLFALLATERISIFAAGLQLSFLLFESLRSQLKFQLEHYLTRVADMIMNDSPRILYEARELAMDNLLQLWRIPGFAAELYINYDCDLYCSNLFEDLTKLLSKNTLSATQAIYSIHTLSMDALLTIVESIERNCAQAKNGQKPKYMRHSRNNSYATAKIVLDAGTPQAAREAGGQVALELEEGDPEEGAGNTEPAVLVENISKFLHSSQRDRISRVAAGIGTDVSGGEDPSTAAEGASLSEAASQKLTHEELAAIKRKKRLLTQGTDLFNQRPEKGIQFLQENGLLNPVLDPQEVAQFLRENSGLDKKMIGEYISKKKNVESRILEVYVKSFDFAGLTIDQALRLYLETFRLPGEAPLISLVMEHFADHWHECNNEPFANTDAAFRLAYAVIMLNMDQHNHNAKRLNVPMTVEDFLRNLRGLNGNSDFDQEMLTKIYHAIRNEEIVMPAEQTGQVRENYLWKVLLRRGATKDGIFHHVFGPQHDRELYRVIQGSTLAALSFVFDKSLDNASLYQKAIGGFMKSAAIAAHFQLHGDFDALVLTLCKFTTLLTPPPNDAHEITASVMFGQNVKAQLAMRTVFGLIHEHGDCMREGWRHTMDVLLQLFKLKLLPKALMEAEDFCETSGKVTLLREPNPLPKTEAGLFSSLYSYLANDGQRQPSYEEQEVIKLSRKCVRDCQIEQIVNESKFLQLESLEELIGCLLAMIVPPEAHKSTAPAYGECTVVFLLELLVKVLIQNRDRLLPVWGRVQDKLYTLLVGASAHEYTYLLQRTTVALLKLAIYLMRNEEICSTILQSLRMLLALRPAVILAISKPISIGMYELLKTSAQNIHTEADWVIVFTVLECVGAGAVPPECHAVEQVAAVSGAKSDGALSSEEDSGLPDRGYISDSELSSTATMPLVKTAAPTPPPAPLPSSPSAGDAWIMVNKDAIDLVSGGSGGHSPGTPVRHSIQYHCKLLEHSPFALVKCWESLAFIVRNVAHITPYNFESCVRCIRTFVEASMGQTHQHHQQQRDYQATKKKPGSGKDRQRKLRDGASHQGAGLSSSSSSSLAMDSSDSESEELPERYQSISIQLLDLMHTLHTRTAQIFRWWAEEGGAVPQCSSLWSQGWCPLLQGIARLATDQRRQVRTSAITCLQRALLVQDLQTLTGLEWAGCFKQVLFPLLQELLQEKATSPVEVSLLEESRIRTATIMSKVFLHHLTPLIALPNFQELWLEILDYFERFMTAGSDMLYEAVLESLKNMLLVMHSVCVFHNTDGVTHSMLWDVTWQRISGFLPNLKDELFKHEAVRSSVSISGGTGGNASTGAASPTVPPSHTTAPTAPPSLAGEQQHILEGGQINNSSAVGESINPRVVLHPIPVSTVATGSALSASPPNSYIQQLQQPQAMPVLPVSHSVPAVEVHRTPVHRVAPSNNLLMSSTATSDFNALPMVLPRVSTLPSPTGAAESSITGLVEPANLLLSSPARDAVTQPQPAVSAPSSVAPAASNIIELPGIVGTSCPAPPAPPQQSPTERREEQGQSETGSERAPLVTDVETGNVPMSHLLAGSQYPSLQHVPIGIAQSFAPIFVQPNPAPAEASDIYSDYINDPYNLTLQIDNGAPGSAPTSSVIAPEPLPPQSATAQPDTLSRTLEDAKTAGPMLTGSTTVTATPSAQLANVFQSAQYFSFPASGHIPPGSEMLFGEP
ncbi:Golgi-specific brefeldin A-resistance guanine nucleotide exchange factor 1 [Anopheles merus]|uniref:SEC7 domain-containing protein n=1 Tax=Anopheles merus TaxID=30066 RepID=A0A182V9T6_ANOME|nr:Golgi-specific brefeldin A-resistance guanine nucleotide exchange factor 1 [Anopheles merus]